MKKFILIAGFLLALGVMQWGLSLMPAEKDGDGAEGGGCPKLLFNYPLLLTDRARIHAEKFEEHHRYGQEGVLVIPEYLQGSLYRRTRKLNYHVTLGKPFLIVPDETRTLGALIQEASPEALEAESFLFFVKGCPPVDHSAYFPGYATQTHPVQIIGVHKLPPQQSKQLNAIILREFSRPGIIQIPYDNKAVPFETALETEKFFGYDNVCWPRECTEEEYRAMYGTGSPSAGDYTVSLMVKWDTGGAGSTVEWHFTESELSLIQGFLQAL